MRETYVALGVSMPWSVSLFGALVMFVPFLWMRARGRKVTVTPAAMMMAAMYGVFGLLELPVEWTIPGMMIIAGIAALIPSRERPVRLARRVLVAAACLATGAVIFVGFGAALLPDRITLGPDSVSWKEMMDAGTVPRAGLRVHTTGSPKPWWQNQPTHSWTTYSGDDLGPYVSGSMLYLGPHGLVKGDEVGRRLAKWAGTTPRYRMYGSRD